MNELQTTTIIQNRIFIIRGQKVMIDRDLAELYKVKTMVLNQAVKRNLKRFPDDFMFKLTPEELKELITNCDRFEKLKHSPTTPHAFTEQGVAMLSTVLNSETAIEINIQIMRVFAKMRQWAIENKEMALRLQELEHYFIQHCKDNQADMQKIYDALGLLMDRTKPTQIGYKTD
ncbi:MAG: ORF6N domain-containing protein [Candidatus Gastranaerophilales bacterium]|nr:ORF6N domain-containing protein [Candidatus Gastranaerophilales bacterium]